MLYFTGQADHMQRMCFHFTNKDDGFGLINQGLSDDWTVFPYHVP